MRNHNESGRAKAVRAHEDRPDYARHSRRRQQDNKLAQMCRQVQRTLAMSLSGECHDEVLQQLSVHSVLPAPDASRLLVQVYFAGSRSAVPLLELLQRLERVNAWLRSEVAHALVRKRAPELSYQLVSLDMAMAEEDEYGL